jgi:hypothetical protein
MVGKRMELEELVQSTLKELDKKVQKQTAEKREPIVAKPESSEFRILSDEKEFLLNSKEKFETLFNGLKSDDVKKIESKLNLVVNFLQFYNSKLDSRLEKL